jgi:hypothetical protein
MLSSAHLHVADLGPRGSLVRRVVDAQAMTPIRRHNTVMPVWLPSWLPRCLSVRGSRCEQRRRALLRPTQMEGSSSTRPRSSFWKSRGGAQSRTTRLMALGHSLPNVSLDDDSFAGCVALEEVSFRDVSKLTLKSGVFRSCRGLKTVVLPTSMTDHHWRLPHFEQDILSLLISSLEKLYQHGGC